MASSGGRRTLRQGGWLALSLAIGLSAVMALWLASAAQAGWLPPVNVSQSSANIGAPHVVLDAAGNATAVWEHWTGNDTAVAVAYRPAGAGWETPADVSEQEEPLVAGEHDAYSPRVAVDGAGDATIVWARYAGTNRILIQAVYRPAGGSWQAPVDLGEMHSMTDPEPWVAADEAGDTTAVWKSGEVVESSYRPAGGSWEVPVALSAGESFAPEAAMDANDDSVVAWMHYDGVHYVVEGTYRAAGGGWETRRLLSEEGEEAGDPQIAIAGHGEAIVVWDGHPASGDVVRAVYRPAGEGWQAPVDVSGVGAQGGTLRVALDSQGGAVLVWSHDSTEVGAYAITQASYRPAGGEWQQPTNLSQDGENAYPCDVVFDKQGNAAVVWQRSNGSNEIIQADYKPAGEGWQQPTNLSKEGSSAADAVVVLDSAGTSTTADGDATAVWASSEGGGVIQAAGYDANEPSEPLEAPSEGEAGQPVQVSASTSDTWSPRLSFGDGTEQAGASATHTYDFPGEYTVTLSDTEVLGYPRLARKTIVIKPASDGTASNEGTAPKESPHPEPPAETVSPGSGSQPGMGSQPGSGAGSGTGVRAGGGETGGGASTQLKTVLLTQLARSGNSVPIGPLLVRGEYVMPFTTPAAGALTIYWYYVPPGVKLAKRHPAKPVIVASAHTSFARAVTLQVKLRLTSQGKRLLKHVKRVKLLVRASFNESGQPAVTVGKRLLVRR